MPTDPRPLGLKLIIAYKVAKGPLMLVLAFALFARPQASLAWAEHLALQLSSGGWLLHRVGQWLDLYLGVSVVRGARWVALLDGLVTVLEAGLLLSGKSWGEWLVVVGVGTLVPIEAVSLVQHFRWIKVALLVLNIALVFYLTRRRLSLRHRAASGGDPTAFSAVRRERLENLSKDT